MFSMFTNFLRLWTNLMTVQAVIFVETFTQTSSFFLFLFCFIIICTSLMQFKAHLLVVSMSKFADVMEQRAWANRWELLAIMFVIFSSFMLENIYLSKVSIFFLLACQFLPQIFKNTINGYRSVPDVPYTIASFIFTLYFPMYLYAIDDNILFIRPDKIFAMIIICFAGFQVGVIKIQQTHPRFLIPRSIRRQMIARRRANMHDYE